MPSPKVQTYVTTPPEAQPEVVGVLNTTLRWYEYAVYFTSVMLNAQPDVSDIHEGAFTSTRCTNSFSQPVFLLITNFTQYVPALANVCVNAVAPVPIVVKTPVAVVETDHSCVVAPTELLVSSTARGVLFLK